MAKPVGALEKGPYCPKSSTLRMPSLEKAAEREEKKCPRAVRLFVLNCCIIKLRSEMSKMGKTHQIATKSSALID